MSNKSPQKQPPPKSSGKTVTCNVYLLDGENVEISLDKNDVGRALFDKVCTRLDLIERDYFGLTYTDDRGPSHLKYWLNLDKKISKQKKRGAWVFEFALKFYPPDPSQLRESLTRWLVVLQVRRDLLSGRIPCTFTTYALLGSYNVQADIGEYDPSDHGHSYDYIKDMAFAPNQTPELLEKIAELHKLHKGQTPDEAEKGFLDNAKKLAMYGIDLHKAKDSDNNAVMIGVCCSGLLVFRDKLRLNRFVWPKILKLSYKRNHFYIKIRPGEMERNETTIMFKLDNHRLAKRLWKTCVEHHAFFRLREAEKPTNNVSFPRFGSKFRYSGRTLYQTRQTAALLDRPPPFFERSQPARNTMHDTGNRSRSMDELGNRKNRDSYEDGKYYDPNRGSKEYDPNKYGDERDRRDHKGVPTAFAQAGKGSGTRGSGDEDTLQRRPYDSDTADRTGRLPGQGEATLEHERGRGHDDSMGLAAGVGIDGHEKAETDKERRKREKEEDKKRKKEAEEKKKKEEEEKKKKKKKGKGDLDTSEDRADKLGYGDATETAPGYGPGSAGLDSGKNKDGYYKDGKWIPYNEEDKGYNKDGKWYPYDKGSDCYNKDGKWYPCDKLGDAYYHKDGEWYPYDKDNNKFNKDGKWRPCDEDNKGYHDKDGKWRPYDEGGKGCYKDGKWYPYDQESNSYYKDGKWHPCDKDDEGYYDKDGKWVPYEEEDKGYNKDGKWYPYDKNRDTYNKDGKWCPCDKVGDAYYGKDGKWYPYDKDRNCYYKDGKWSPCDEDNKGYYDQDGKWRPYDDGGKGCYKDGKWYPYDQESNSYYKDGKWHPCDKDDKGYYDKDGNWIPYDEEDKGYNKDGKWYPYDKNSDTYNKDGKWCPCDKVGDAYYGKDGKWYPYDKDRNCYYKDGKWSPCDEDDKGYLNKDGKWRPYDDGGKGCLKDGKWYPYDKESDCYYKDGKWHPCDNEGKGYYDKDGKWHPYEEGDKGYIKDGRWYPHDKDSDTYNKDGKWHPCDKDGIGYYKDGKWYPYDKKSNCYYKDGKWHPCDKDDKAHYQSGKLRPYDEAGKGYYKDGKWYPYDKDTNCYYKGGKWCPCEKDGAGYGKGKDKNKDKKGGLFGRLKKGKHGEDGADDSRRGKGDKDKDKGKKGGYGDEPDISRDKQKESKGEEKKKHTSSSIMASLCIGRSPVKKANLLGAAAGLPYGVGLGIGKGDMTGVVGEEKSVDNKQKFVPVPKPIRETKESLKSGYSDNLMPFFDPAATSTVGRGKVPPPVPPKGSHALDDSFNPPTVATEKVKYNPNISDVPMSSRNIPLVKTETRTVTYERDNCPYDLDEGMLVSAQSHSSRLQTIETTTYKTEKDGIEETKVVQKVVMSGDEEEDYDFDAALADAIRSVTEFNPDMSVERIECVQQIEDVKNGK